MRGIDDVQASPKDLGHFGAISGDEKICGSSTSKNRSSCTIFWNILYFTETIINIIMIGAVGTYKTGSIPVTP